MTKDGAEEFYKKQKEAGETENITSNDNPDFSLPFYQEIFSLMEGFAAQSKEHSVTHGNVTDKSLMQDYKSLYYQGCEIITALNEELQKSESLNDERIIAFAEMVCHFRSMGDFQSNEQLLTLFKATEK